MALMHAQRVLVCPALNYAKWLAKPERAKLRRLIIRRLKGKRLACHCKPDLPCHAEVLAALANEPRAALAALCELCE